MAKADTFEMEVSPLSGDPVISVIAQVNRWREQYGQPLYPLTAEALNNEVASYALAIMMKRYAVVAAQSLDFSQLNELAMIQEAYNSGAVSFVKQNATTIAYALYRYGNDQGLPRAIYGYGAQKVPTWMIVTAVGGGLLGISALMSMLAKRRRRLKAA